MKKYSFLVLMLSVLYVNCVRAQDNMKGSWLPDSKQNGNFGDVDNFLKSVQGSFRPLVCDYNGNILDEKSAFNNGTAKLNGSSWTCSVKQAKPERDALELDVNFKLDKGQLKSGGVAVAFDFTGWSRDNFVLVPSYIYNANRFYMETNGYMAPYPERFLYNKDAPQLFSNTSHLAFDENTPAKIEGLSGNASTPAMCFYSPEKKRGFIMLFEQRSRFGDHGIFIEENAAQDAASFVISAPGVREQRAGFGEFTPSTDKAMDWKEGDMIDLKVRIYNFQAKSVLDLYEKFMNVRKSLTGPNNPRNLSPMSYTVEVTAGHKNNVRWKELPDGGYYRMENSDGYQAGWVGGLMDTYAMLALNDPLSMKRVFSTYDYVLLNMQGKSGYFYGAYRDGKQCFDRKEIENSALVRKNADILFWMVKQFDLLKLQGYADKIKPEWEKIIEKLAWAFVDTWEKHGEFGNYVNLETGEIIIRHSTSGSLAPAALVLASEYFDEPKFFEVAKESAKYMYDKNILELGFTSGACGDIMQDADSESNFAFVESLMALYYKTSDKQWLERARNVANIAATWTISYDYVFPANSTIGKLKGNVAGAVWASTQNKHAAPGICTISADHMFKIYRATGDRRYAELLRDINHAHAEVMETPGRPTTGMGPGTSMERIQTCDADGKGAIGVILHTSNGWTETNGMFMGLEIPGIYIQTDKDEMYVFDHVEVRTLKRDKSGITLEITNPTRFDASVAVFQETSKEAKKPLGYSEFLKWKKVNVKSGETVTYKVVI